MSVVFARLANAEDSDDVARILTAVAGESARHRGVPFARPYGPDTVTCVGGVGQSIFGVLVASHTNDTTWTIHQVHVEEAARGVGVGDALMRAALAELSRRGAHTIESGAQPGDRALKNLFERHGLVARTIIVGREI